MTILDLLLLRVRRHFGSKVLFDAFAQFESVKRRITMFSPILAISQSKDHRRGDVCLRRVLLIELAILLAHFFIWLSSIFFEELWASCLLRAPAFLNTVFPRFARALSSTSSPRDELGADTTKIG